MRWILPLVAGFVLGWLTRDLTRLSPGTRVVHDPVRRGAEVPAPPAGRPAPPPEAAEEETAPPAAGEEAPPAAVPETPAAEEEDGLAAMMRAQMPAMRAYASMQAKQRGGPIVEALDLDPETARAVLALLAEEAGRQAELVFTALLEGEDVDPNAFYYMQGLGPDLSPELMEKLAPLLGSAALADLRAGAQEAHRKLVDDQVEMQINMMGIADLTPTQRAEVKDLFRGQDRMREDMGRFATVMRDRERMERLLEGEGLAEEMEASMAPRRERMRHILTPQQFERYLDYEKRLVEQARMGIRMWGSMLGRKAEPSDPR